MRVVPLVPVAFILTLAGLRKTSRCLLLAFSLVALSSWQAASAQRLKVTADHHTVTIIPDTSAVPFNFRVLNDSTVALTVDLTCLTSGNLSACTGVPSSVTIPARQSVFATPTVDIGAVGHGKITIRAHVGRTTVSDTTGVIIAPPAAAEVTPDGLAVTVPEAATATQDFNVHNPNSDSLEFTLATTCAGAVTNCTVTSPASPTTVPGNGDTTVTVSFQTGFPRTRGKVALIASLVGYESTVVDTGSVFTTADTVLPPPVAVTPDGDEEIVGSGSAGSAQFFVRNHTLTATTYTISATCTGTLFPVSNCTVAPTAPTVAAGGLDTIIVQWSPTQAAGTTGQIVLLATQSSPSGSASDSGVVNLVARPLQQDTARVEVATVNAGTAVDRDLCLTMAVRVGAAWECGALRLVHPLRSIRTMNKVRTPTLLYNSALAQPEPIVRADVTMGDSALAPDTVWALLKMNGVTKDSVTLAGGAFWPGTTHRLVLRYDAVHDSTGVYPYTVVVELKYDDGDVLKTSSVTGTLVVINRATSHFGAGWWLAGLEQLYFPTADTTTRLWVGGDGSSRVFSKVASNVWVAPSLAWPDTLKWTGSRYVRYLPHGLQVQFDATGRHVATIDRLGHETDFTYDGSAPSRLTAIALPPTTASKQYTFWYTSGVLDSISNPGPGPSGTEQRRRTGVTIASGRLTAIRDCASASPICSADDTTSVAFYYASGTNVVDSVRDRLGATQSYHYDALNELAQTTFVVDSTQTIALEFRNPDSVSRPASNTATAVAPESVYVAVRGPRTDLNDTRSFWINQYGAPTRIVDALGAITTLARTDSRWPALVTSVVYPGGHTVLASYDTRGNATDVTDQDPYGNGQDAVTHAHYDGVWSLMDSLVTPTGVTSTFAYDSSTGNRLWQQVGSDTARRVTFAYADVLHLLSSTTLPLTASDSVEYDALGNVSAVRSPREYWTKYFRDALGRDTLDVSPIDSSDHAHGGSDTSRARQCIYYDALDRDTLSEQIGPAMSGAPQQTIMVRKRYDREGHLLSLMRKGLPDASDIDSITTAWRYDMAGRTRAEIAPDGMVDSTAYDAAGNPVVNVTRRGDVLSVQYDALNRLVEKNVSAVSYETWYNGIPSVSSNPLDQVPYGGITIPEDHLIFAYDTLGNLVEADDGAARVTRTYYPNRALKSETQAVRTLAPIDSGGNFEQHVYTVGYTYDMDGRRIALKHPPQLMRSVTGSVVDSSRYAYDTQTGALAKVWDLGGNEFDYVYDLRGDLDTLRLGDKLVQTWTHDDDDNLIEQTAAMPDTLSQNRRETTLSYDARGKILSSANITGLFDTLTASYSGLGYLTQDQSILTVIAYQQETQFVDRHVTAEVFGLDALANTLTSSQVETTRNSSETTDQTWWYVPLIGRLGGGASGATEARLDSVRYDSAGNTVFTWSGPSGSTSEEADRASFYAADGRLAAADYRTLADPRALLPGPRTSVFEEYRYDALGRRVLVHATLGCRDIGSPLCSMSMVRRTTWDGNQELDEVQVPDSLAEEDTVGADINVGTTQDFIDQNPYFGRVAYTFGLTVDQPLSVSRLDYADAPYPKTYNAWAPFTIVPAWGIHGTADFGIFAESAVDSLCASPGGVHRCVAIGWPLDWNAHNLPTEGFPSWQGTILEDKRDKAATLYRRARVYDPVTGRFTQEDPIGLAGGLNVYGFADGDPISYADPFGLKVCFRGSPGQVQMLKRGTEDATGTTIQLDSDDNCIRSFSPTGDKGFNEIQHRFALMVASQTSEFGVEFGDSRQDFYSHFDDATNTAIILPSDYQGGFYRTGGWFSCAMTNGSDNAYWTLGGLIAHELIGHGAGVVLGTGAALQPEAIRIENLYHAARNQPPRCPGGR